MKSHPRRNAMNRSTLNDRPTVTVGIPAHNEEKNVGRLLASVVAQRQDSFSLSRIIVVDDGSTDQTSASVRHVKSPLVALTRHSRRKGKVFCFEDIRERTTSDFLMLLDADVRIKDGHFLSTIIGKAVAGKADVASPSVEALPPHGLVQRILYESTRFKKELYERHQNGENIFTCHGRTILLSKRVYRSIRFSNVVVDDSYIYLWCLQHRYRYQYIPSATVFYTLPSSFADHRKQSLRFFASERHLASQFDSNAVRDAYRLPPLFVLPAMIKFILMNPLIIVYFLLAIYLKLESLFRKDLSTIWPIAHSSKLLEEGE